MYIHLICMYVLCIYFYIHVYTMYIRVLYTYVLTCTDFPPLLFFSSMPTLKTSNQWPTWRIIRMSSCVSCVSMLVLVTCNTTRPCSKSWTRILHLILCLQTSMRWIVLLWLTVIWTYRASLGFGILHIWSCWLAERHNRQFRYFPVFYLYILCLCVYVPCIYVSVQACTLYIHITWCAVQANTKNSAGSVRLDMYPYRNFPLDSQNFPLNSQNFQQTHKRTLEYSKSSPIRRLERRTEDYPILETFLFFITELRFGGVGAPEGPRERVSLLVRKFSAK